MSTSNKNNSENDQNKSHEPEVAYKAIRIFNSFEEAEEADIRETLAQSPEERISETVDLILRVYGFTQKELNKRVPGTWVRRISRS